MLFCINCGAKLKDDDTICPNCGAKINSEEQNNKQLQNKQPQRCEQEQNCQETQGNQETEETQDTQDNNSIKSDLIYKILINMLIKPISSAKEFVRECKINYTVVLTLLLMVIQGILGIWKSSQVMNDIQYMARYLIKGFTYIIDKIQPGTSQNISDSNLITIMINKFKICADIPYDRIFVQNCIIYLAGIASLFAAVCLLILAFSKKKISLFTLYKVSLIISVPVLYSEFFAILFSYVSFVVGICIFLIGWFISVICLAGVFKDILEIDENYSLFYSVISFTIVIIIAILILKIFISSDAISMIKSFQDSLNSTSR